LSLDEQDSLLANESLVARSLLASDAQRRRKSTAIARPSIDEITPNMYRMALGTNAPPVTLLPCSGEG
jgi:hypothetical protein